MLILIKSHKGQIVIVLLLTMLVALAVGLTITQRSITDIATSTQTEQSSRALSAAEAGIEKALSLGDNPTSNIPTFDLGNQSSAKVNIANNLPRLGQALEYPPIGKESVAQFWLANPQTAGSFYTQSAIDIYFGSTNTQSIKPAIEISLIYKDASNKYLMAKKFIDTDSSRAPATNGFEMCADLNPTGINTTSSADTTSTTRMFLCRYNLNFTSISQFSAPVLIRARILYSSDSQPVAVSSTVAGCSTTSCSLPPQAVIYTSVGTAGQSQKTLQVFKTEMVPFFFDYAIFSTGEIVK